MISQIIRNQKKKKKKNDFIGFGNLTELRGEGKIFFLIYQGGLEVS